MKLLKTFLLLSLVCGWWACSDDSGQQPDMEFGHSHAIALLVGFDIAMPLAPYIPEDPMEGASATSLSPSLPEENLRTSNGSDCAPVGCSEGGYLINCTKIINTIYGDVEVEYSEIDCPNEVPLASQGIHMTHGTEGSIFYTFSSDLSGNPANGPYIVYLAPTLTTEKQADIQGCIGCSSPQNGGDNEAVMFWHEYVINDGKIDGYRYGTASQPLRIWVKNDGAQYRFKVEGPIGKTVTTANRCPFEYDVMLSMSDPINVVGNWLNKKGSYTVQATQGGWTHTVTLDGYKTFIDGVDVSNKTSDILRDHLCD